MHCIAALGNPGPKFENTRHNAGWIILDNLISFWGIQANRVFEKKRNAEVMKISLDEKQLGLREGKLEGKVYDVLLVKPQTYMNLSGQSIQPILSFYKIHSTQLLLVSDDLDQDFGAIKYKPRGGSGGQNGIKSTIQKLGTEEFFRLKIGIGRPSNPRFDIVDRVLSSIKTEELGLWNTKEFMLTASRYVAMFLQGKK